MFSERQKVDVSNLEEIMSSRLENLVNQNEVKIEAVNAPLMATPAAFAAGFGQGVGVSAGLICAAVGGAALGGIVISEA